MKNITVLITGAGTVTCQSIIKGLRLQREYAVKIITADMQALNAGVAMSDDFYKIPPANDPSFINSIFEICQNEQVDLVIPIVDYEFDAFSKNKARFQEIGCDVVISSPEVIDICNDKWKTYQFFKELKILTPATWLVEELDYNNLSFPLFIKPRLMGRASIDAYLIEDIEELKYQLKKLDNPLIQEAVKGKEYTVDVLCDFEGKAINGVVRERIETKSGVSYRGKSVRDDVMLNQAIKIAEALPIIGPTNIQCFKDEATGKNCFFEVNPRYSGTLILSIAAGFNSPLQLLKLKLNDPITMEMGAYKDDIYMFRYWEESFYSGDSKEFISLL